LFLKAMMYGQERLARNHFASYVVQDGSGLLVRLLATDSAFLEAEGLWWNPALDYGRDRSEVREDLNNAEIIQWLLLSQLTIFDRRDLWPTSEGPSPTLRAFRRPRDCASAVSTLTAKTCAAGYPLAPQHQAAVVFQRKGWDRR
jgi:hypothetical protein